MLVVTQISPFFTTQEQEILCFYSCFCDIRKTQCVLLYVTVYCNTML